MPYADASSQTVIAGLTKHPSAVPSVLVPTDTATPPDDMPSKPHQQLPFDPTNLSPTSTIKKYDRPRLRARISLPDSQLEEDPPSPPPTHMAFSPLPEANKLHAGHTPLIPMARSPLKKAPSGELTPEEMLISPDHMSPEEAVEVVLTGPLTLPSMPTDGSSDRIELKVLNAVLEKVAQSRGGGKEIEASESAVEKKEGEAVAVKKSSRSESSSSDRRGSEFDTVDGVILKTPPMNFGAPLGAVRSR